MFTLVLGVLNISKACITGHMMDLTSFCNTKLVFLFTAKSKNKHTGEESNRDTYYIIHSVALQQALFYDAFQKVINSVYWVS